MIVNAYKLSIEESKRSELVTNKSFNVIIKELVGDFIKNEMNLIENNKVGQLKEKAINKLYNVYHLINEDEINNIANEIINKIFGYGILQKYIDNQNISDIRVTAFNSMYIKEKGKWKKIKEAFESSSEFEEFVRFCALKNNANINFETPIAIFSDRNNSLRIEAGIEPANVSSPSIVIRIHRNNIAQNLEELFKNFKMMDKKSYGIIKNHINPLDNVILCGKGGSGKTTLLRALIERIPKEIAITTNEETAELYLQDRNVIQRECILNRNDEKNIDLEMLSRHSLVMSNDVIIIGELKGKEANSFFDSISTGHTGLATVHADSARNTVDRLITLIKKESKAQYYSENFLRRFLSSSIDYIIFMKDFKVNEIFKLVYDEETMNIKYLCLYKLGKEYK